MMVGLIQTSCGPDPSANLEKTLGLIGEAARQGAQIICLQELFRSLYFCQTEDPVHYQWAEPIPGGTTEILGECARRYGVVLISSLFERRAPGLYHNTAAVFEVDGRLLGLYRKMHIPEDPLYYEKYYFTPGDLGFRAFETAYGKVGVLICWDQWYPEAARLTALEGPWILFYPAAIGWHPAEKKIHGEAQHEAWRTMQRSHAIANGVYVAAVNRVGHELISGEGIEFWGGSFVSDPFGTLLREASHDQEEILVVECDLKKIEEVRRNWPFLRDRRIDSYGKITHRWSEEKSSQ